MIKVLIFLIFDIEIILPELRNDSLRVQTRSWLIGIDVMNTFIWAELFAFIRCDSGGSKGSVRHFSFPEMLRTQPCPYKTRDARVHRESVYNTPKRATANQPSRPSSFAVLQGCLNHRPHHRLPHNNRRCTNSTLHCLPRRPHHKRMAEYCSHRHNTTFNLLRQIGFTSSDHIQANQAPRRNQSHYRLLRRLL